MGNCAPTPKEAEVHGSPLESSLDHLQVASRGGSPISDATYTALKHVNAETGVPQSRLGEGRSQSYIQGIETRVSSMCTATATAQPHNRNAECVLAFARLPDCGNSDNGEPKQDNPTETHIETDREKECVWQRQSSTDLRLDLHLLLGILNHCQRCLHIPTHACFAYHP